MTPDTAAATHAAVAPAAVRRPLPPLLVRPLVGAPGRGRLAGRSRPAADSGSGGGRRPSAATPSPRWPRRSPRSTSSPTSRCPPPRRSSSTRATPRRRQLRPDRHRHGVEPLPGPGRGQRRPRARTPGARRAAAAGTDVAGCRRPASTRRRPTPLDTMARREHGHPEHGQRQHGQGHARRRRRHRRIERGRRRPQAPSGTGNPLAGPRASSAWAPCRPRPRRRRRATWRRPRPPPP